MRRAVAPGAPVVVKVGTSSLVQADGTLDPDGAARAVAQVAALWKQGHPTVLVSSGAVAAGLPALGLTERPRDVPMLQVAAAVGQGRLMAWYMREFSNHGLVAGQVLLTKDVLANRPQYVHARKALEHMLAAGVVPIVNENDTVAVEELKIGDNDRLAAVVSHLVGAGMLVLLTDTAGLYSGDPRLDDTAELLNAVRYTDQILDDVMQGKSGRFGSGGVGTKVAAARMAAWSGVPTVIAPAANPEAALKAISGSDIGTWVQPHHSGLSARKLWIAFGQPSEGSVHIDAGAVYALVERGKSLLPAGITAVDGSFGSWAGVEVLGPDGEMVGKGLASLPADDLRAAIGQHSSDVGGEAIHRDDLVVFVDP